MSRRVRRQARRARRVPRAPRTYTVIYADPPWRYQERHGWRCAVEKHYPTMPLADIKQLPIPAAPDSVLFLWATMPMLSEALEVVRAWGFEYKTVAFTWMKQNRSGHGLFMGMGGWTRANAEICLLATRGRPRRVSRRVHSAVLSPVRRHSEKPDEVRQRIVELLGDVPKLEMFARTKAPGWDVWGNEAPDPIELPRPRDVLAKPQGRVSRAALVGRATRRAKDEYAA